MAGPTKPTRLPKKKTNYLFQHGTNIMYVGYEENICFLRRKSAKWVQFLAFQRERERELGGLVGDIDRQCIHTTN